MLLRNRTKPVEISTVKLGLFPSLATVPRTTLRMTYNIIKRTLDGQFQLIISLPTTWTFSGRR